MIENLLALMIYMQNPDGWKEEVYEQKYNQAISKSVLSAKNKQSEQPISSSLQGNISWYAKGLKNPQALTTACWDTYPKGTRFSVSYNGNSVVVVCNDRGHFREMGRMLDLSSGAFERLAPLSVGIIRGAKVEVIK